MAALIGAYVGIILQLGLAAWFSGLPVPDWSEALEIPVLIFWYGLIALPFVSFGLAIFGIPAARLLHRWRHRPWMGIVAAISGALAGKLLFYGIAQLSFHGSHEFWAFDPIGLCYGMPTGLAWWWFKRDE
ncbi:MAG TPA: hypothetical protein VN029_10260 [Sphingomonas sp.]|nr:hypothetical protein [Sphingomonas sp.]